jgi:hypothetical protein
VKLLKLDGIMLRGTMYFYRDCLIPRRIVEALDILGSMYIVPRRIVDTMDIFGT